MNCIQTCSLIDLIGQASQKSPELNNDERYVVSQVSRPLLHAGAMMRQSDTPV